MLLLEQVEQVERRQQVVAIPVGKPLAQDAAQIGLAFPARNASRPVGGRVGIIAPTQPSPHIAASNHAGSYSRAYAQPGMGGRLWYRACAR